MTSEQAVQYVLDKASTYDPIDNFCRVFACEDIVEMGVEEWVEMNASDILLDINTFAEEVSLEAASHLIDSDDIDKSSAVNAMVNSYINHGKAVAKLFQIREAIALESQR